MCVPQIYASGNAYARLLRRRALDCAIGGRRLPSHVDVNQMPVGPALPLKSRRTPPQSAGRSPRRIHIPAKRKLPVVAETKEPPIHHSGNREGFTATRAACGSGRTSPLVACRCTRHWQDSNRRTARYMSPVPSPRSPASPPFDPRDQTH